MSFIKVLDAATAANSKPVSQSTCTFVCQSKANHTAGDYFVLDDGWTRKLYQLDKTGTDTALVPQTMAAFADQGVTLVRIDISAATDATSVGDLAVTAVAAAQRIVPVNTAGSVACTSKDWINTRTIRPNQEAVTHASFTMSQWSGSTQGFELGPHKRTAIGSGALNNQDQLWLLVRSNIKTGTTMTAALRVWVLSEATTRIWTPLGAGPDTTKGMINLANAAATFLIGEDQTNELSHTELMTGMAIFDRFYLELVSVDAVTTAIDAFVATRGSAAGMV